MENQTQEHQNQSSILNFMTPETDLQKLSRKASTYVDLELAKREASILLSGDNADNELKKIYYLKKNQLRFFIYIII